MRHARPTDAAGAHAVRVWSADDRAWTLHAIYPTEQDAQTVAADLRHAAPGRAVVVSAWTPADAGSAA